ncbi:uncharacterized protein PFLUO_LOCUS8140 [Penicillium psychrofluorescens]|uniref:uncharacterized protein n=1 Tax=Penicillium psychrofluorescens TaxID=3158075 RepID=UPI003CCD44B8
MTAHTKSRYGCDHCRRRRVKCDEQGPPCTNCVLRQLENCTYSRVLPESLIANARRESHGTIPTSPTIVNLLNGVAPTSPPPPRAVEDLELMHQFAADTYKSLCVSDLETHTWQWLVPRLAFKHRYLMHGILALASLHIATTLEPAEARTYIDTGLEYHSLSLGPFRLVIDNLTPENCDAAFALSVVTTAISLALPRLTAARENISSIVENIITVFELLQGVKRILVLGESWINLELFSQGQYWKDTAATLDEDTDSALTQLAALNEQTKASGDETHYRINKDVIEHLRHCFMKFSCSPDPAPVLAWLAAVDKGFVDSLRQRRPFSLLVLAYWGLLLNELDGQRWWARGSGRALVSELLNALDAEDLLWESCLAWVQRKISLKSRAPQSDISSPLV